MSFEDDLKAAREAPIEFTDVPVEIRGNLHTLRFLQLSGPEWAAETDRHPARPGVLLDMRYGYNLRTLCMAVAKLTGRRVITAGGEETLVELTAEQWDDLYRAIPGATKSRIDDAIWGLNEANPQARVDALKKGSAGA
jgi:hypothetical protein